MTEFLQFRKSNCKNCYKCIRHCPVKSIRFSCNQAHIVPDECILCGQCFVVCPQNAKVIYNTTEKAKVLLASGSPVIASIAPSFVANYKGTDIKSMETALKQLGFFMVEETAIGATIVKKQYENIIKEGKQDIIISSCCHTVNLMIQKYFPEALPHLARVISPMQAHCKDIKKRYPNAKTIFIGPCISKKAEAEECPDDVDCVLTFEELTKWLEAENIKLEPAATSTDYTESREGLARFFPTAGGILKSMDCSDYNYQYLSVDGLENCINTLNDISENKLEKCFIEMSACSGSCIGGPVMDKPNTENHNLNTSPCNDSSLENPNADKLQRTPISDYFAVAKYAGNEDFNVSIPSDDSLNKVHKYLGINNKQPTEREIYEILRQMGKTKKEDELNCGSCGYNSCKEKAIAVYQGKADMSMCLPFLKEKAESFSNNILNNTPNGIIIVNDSLEVQQINETALNIMNIRHASDIVGEQVVRILDPINFLKVKQTGQSIRNELIYLAEYKKYVEETIILDKNYHTLMCIMRDVTTEEKQRLQKEQISRQTIEVTDKVVEKQMRVVQEIASLLGETTAETKVALTKLKEALSDE